MIKTLGLRSCLTYKMDGCRAGVDRACQSLMSVKCPFEDSSTFGSSLTQRTDVANVRLDDEGGLQCRESREI